MSKNKHQNIKKYKCVKDRILSVSNISGPKFRYNCTKEDNGSDDTDYFCDEITQVDNSAAGKKITKLLSGPISLSYHPNVFGRAFYIFGDEHTNAEGLCQSKDSELLYDYLDKVFKKTDLLTDFFVEFPLVQKDASSVLPEQGAKDDIIMGKMFIKFKDCLLPDKTICKLKYPKLRLHYVDIRRVAEKNKNIVTDNFLSYFLSILTHFYEELDEIGITSRKNLSEIDEFKMDFLLSMSPRTFDVFVDHYFTKADNLKKFITDVVYLTIIPKWEINDIPWYYSVAEFVYPNYGNKIARQLQMTIPKVSKELLRFYSDKLKPLKSEYKRIWTMLYNYNKHDLMDTFMDNYGRLLQIIFNTTILQLDIFVLARIFKSTLQDSKEVWIYMGESHTENYSQFIIDYLKIPEMIQSKNINQRCIDVSSIQVRN